MVAEFGPLVVGYTELPAAETITLKNEGDADADLSEAVSSAGTAQGQYFDITWQAQTVKSGDSVLFTIQPKMNLTANATETFTITDNTTGNTIPITATVTVNPASHSLDISKTNATTIPDFTFAQKKYLLKIKLPHNLKTIGQRVFSNCGRLAGTLELPASVTAIEFGAFMGCDNLRYVLATGDKITTLGDELFGNGVPSKLIYKK